jgi:GDPmannose 4,6-dehydratase
MKKNNKSIAFIAGITGQDGAHLADLLLKNGYEVYGGFRPVSLNKMWRLDFLGITKKIQLVEFQLDEPQHIIDILKKIQPDEIYNVAGESFVADSFDYPSNTIEINTIGVVNILEAVRLVSPRSKIFFASSAEVFGYAIEDEGLNEQSIRKPCNPYAISKLTADNFVRLYREKYGLFACSGILFNHEGPLRSRHFVTRKITYNMVRMKKSDQRHFELGNLSASRDWGSAEDYVGAMKLMLEADTPVDFVISTGKLTTVRQFLEIAAKSVGFDPVFEGSDEQEVCIDKSSGILLVKVSPKYYRPFDTPPMLGDSSLIGKKLGWQAKDTVSNIVKSMVDADLDRRKKGITDV